MPAAQRDEKQIERDQAKKKEALDVAYGQIERQYGKGAIMRLGERGIVEIRCIPTGSLSLDLALGGRGVPRGRVIEIFGPESSGKTTLALHMIANAQRSGGVAAFIDAEHALDPTYAGRLGVNVEELLVSQPDHGEQALEITEMLVRSGAVDVVVIDSVAALVPKAEIEGEMGDSHVGLQARLMSQALRKLTAAISRSQTIVVFINQIRQKIGVMFGNPETTTGGLALKFYASVRLDIRRIGSLKEGDQLIGNRTRVTVVKNKLAPPFKKAEFDIVFNEGISLEGDLIDLGLVVGSVQKSGAWFTKGETRLGQGRERARIFLKDNPDIARQIQAEVREQLVPHPVVPETAASAEAPGPEAGADGGGPAGDKADNASAAARGRRRGG
ncbi:MAG: recombinase RecA [Planctomycetes bacterium]|nr:recombinase RecA [Planctomycetota bacterium]